MKSRGSRYVGAKRAPEAKRTQVPYLATAKPPVCPEGQSRYLTGQSGTNPGGRWGPEIRSWLRHEINILNPIGAKFEPELG